MREFTEFEIEHGHQPCVFVFGDEMCGVKLKGKPGSGGYGLPEDTCDKSFACCRDKHDNAVRFPSHPLMPDELLAIRRLRAERNKEKEPALPPPVYVQARNGAYYTSPLFVFLQGFVTFNVDGVEIVLWAQEAARERSKTVFDLLVQVFGHDGFDPNCIDVSNVGLYSDPTAEEPTQRLAVGYFLNLTRRIPIPKVHHGITSRSPRTRGATILHLPSHYLDAEEVG